MFFYLNKSNYYRDQQCSGYYTMRVTTYYISQNFLLILSLRLSSMYPKEACLSKNLSVAPSTYYFVKDRKKGMGLPSTRPCQKQNKQMCLFCCFVFFFFYFSTRAKMKYEI